MEDKKPSQLQTEALIAFLFALTAGIVATFIPDSVNVPLGFCVALLSFAVIFCLMAIDSKLADIWKLINSKK